MQKKPRMILSILTSFLFFAGVLSSCGASGSSLPDGLPALDSSEQNIYADFECTLMESGVLYPNNVQRPGFIRFYDFSSEKEFVLCTKAACSHSDESCPAYYPSFVSAPVIYGGRLYLFSYAEEKNGWNLICASTDGTQRQTLAELNPEDFHCDSLIGGISEVYFTDGCAVFFMDLTNWDGPSEKCLVRLDLNTGKHEYWEASPDWQLAAVSGDRVVITFEEKAAPLLSEAAFFQQNGASADYNDYYKTWFQTNHLQTYSVWDYRQNERTEVISFQGDLPEHDYAHNAWDGMLYITHKSDLYALNMNTLTCQSVLHTDHLYSMQCRAADHVFLLELSEDAKDRLNIVVYSTTDASSRTLDPSFFGSEGTWVFRGNDKHCIGYGKKGLRVGLFSIPTEDLIAENPDSIRFIKYP